MKAAFACIRWDENLEPDAVVPRRGRPGAGLEAARRVQTDVNRASSDGERGGADAQAVAEMWAEDNVTFLEFVKVILVCADMT